VYDEGCRQRHQCHTDTHHSGTQSPAHESMAQDNENLANSWDIHDHIIFEAFIQQHLKNDKIMDYGILLNKIWCKGAARCTLTMMFNKSFTFSR